MSRNRHGALLFFSSNSTIPVKKRVVEMEESEQNRLVSVFYVTRNVDLERP